MKIKKYGVVFICISISLLFTSHELFASEFKKESRKDSCDLILKALGERSLGYSKMIKSYNAELYVKSFVHVQKRNFLMELGPSMFYFPRKGATYLSESISEISYVLPDIYNQKVKATIGTVSRSRAFPAALMPFLNFNFYGGTLLKNKFYSPVSRATQYYYKYELLAVDNTEEGKTYKIKFYPKNNNNQFVDGYMILNEKDFLLREIKFKGTMEYLDFELQVWMGEKEKECYLPDKFNLSIKFTALANVIDYSYSGNFNYEKIELNDYKEEKKRKRSYDLTDSYSFSEEDRDFSSSRQLIDSLRPDSLLPNELDLYEKHFPVQEEKRVETKNKLETKQIIENVLSFFANPNKINVSSQGQLKFSPIINPLFIDYSSRNGFSYYQRTNYTHFYKQGTQLDLAARLAYNFKYKELQFEFSNDYIYWPEKQSLFKFKVGNRNRVLNSKIEDYLETLPKDYFDFDKTELALFNEFYWSTYNGIELSNGLYLNIGLNMNYYKTRKEGRVFLRKYVSEDEIHEKYFKNIRYSYRTLSPRIQLAYTPRQYYYKNNRSKINLYSNYPSFLIEYEQGFNNLWNTNGKYELIEFDMRHQFNISPIRKMAYRFGAGLFTNSKEVYFVNFTNFISSKISLPGWDNKSGGEFQLLSYRKYSTSKYYTQAHVSYQAPLLAALRMGVLNKMILKENIYLGVVFAEGLTPYNELGYRVATGIFDLGIFAGFDRGRFMNISGRIRVGLFEN